MIPEVADFCRLLLFRHPQLSPKDDGSAIGSGPAQLSRRGQQSILGWYELLEDCAVDAVWSGPQPQCADAAAAVAAAKGLETHTDERLVDQHLGEWQGQGWDELAHRDPDRVREFFQAFGEVPAPGGGESLGQAVERFLEWWGEQRVEGLGKTFCVVASGGLISGFAAAMLGMRLERAVCLQLPPAGLGVVDIYGNGARVSAWNVGAKLPASAED